LIVVCSSVWTVIGQGSRTFTIQNQCNEPLWIGTQGNPLPQNGGWKVEAGGSSQITVPSTLSAARFWARTKCVYNSLGRLVCQTGDCPLPDSYYGPNNDGTQCMGIGGLPPYTIAEMTLGGSSGGVDFYDLSLVDGYDIQMSMQPVGGSPSPGLPPTSPYNCGTPKCAKFDYSKCPPVLRLVDKSSGNVIACLSICAAIYRPEQVANYTVLQKIWNGVDPRTGFPMKDLVCCACGPNHPNGCNDRTSEYCCSPYSPPNPNQGGRCYIENWPLASTGQRYDQVFKSQCQDAYSWQFDDSQSTYQCVGANYVITFCPKSTDYYSPFDSYFV